jgi:hypothetical protein
MDKELKSTVITSTLHGVGVEVDNMLEDSNKSEQAFCGRMAALDSIISEMEKCPKIEEEQKEAVLEILHRHRTAANDGLMFQRGVSKALSGVITSLKARFDNERAKAASDNVGKRPSSERSREVRNRKKQKDSSK